MMHPDAQKITPCIDGVVGRHTHAAARRLMSAKVCRPTAEARPMEEVIYMRRAEVACPCLWHNGYSSVHRIALMTKQALPYDQQ